jgi:putative salt-induced outer membrane protein YdiY
MRLNRQWLAIVMLCLVGHPTAMRAQPGAELLPPPSEPWSPPGVVQGEAPSAVGAEEPTAQTAAGAAGSAEEPTNVPEGLIDDDAVAYWYHPAYWIDPMPWDTGLELGINGSSGTSDSFSIRAGGYIKRESRFSKLDLSSYHNRTTTGGESTQNNAQLDARNDWLLDEESPWTLFGSGNIFYDEFQAFDLQTNANTGIGYRFVHDPELGLIGRVGAGTSREFGGPDDRWVPESLFGFEYSQQLTPTQKFYTKLDYFPEWDEFGEFRLVADAGWEIELVQPSNLSLKISANDRYDSTPNGADPHLVNYSVLLLLKL